MFRPRLLTFILVALTCLAVLAPVATHAQDRTEAPESTGTEQAEQEGTQPEETESPPEQNEPPVDTEEEGSNPEIQLQSPRLSVNGAESSLDVTDATSLFATAGSLNEGASYSLAISNGYGCGGGQQVGLGSGSGQLSADLGAFAEGAYSIQAVDASNNLSSNCVNITVQPTLVEEPTDEPTPTDEPAPTDEPIPTDIPATEIPTEETPDTLTETPVTIETGEQPEVPDASPTAENEPEFVAAAVLEVGFDQPSYSAPVGGTVTVTLSITMGGSTDGGFVIIEAPLFATISSVTPGSTGDTTCTAPPVPPPGSSVTAGFSSTDNGSCTWAITLAISPEAPPGAEGDLTMNISANPPFDVFLSAPVTVTTPAVNPLTISANPPNPLPGELVFVTVQHHDPATTPFAGSLQGSIPTGTEFLPDSQLVSCNPGCLVQTIPPATATSVHASYIPEFGTLTTVTLTYAVTIPPETAPGTTFTFQGSGTIDTDKPTGPAEASVIVATPIEPSLTILANPPNPEPGQTMVVTVQQTDPATTTFAATLHGSIPTGTALVSGSSTLSCNPDCFEQHPTTENATSINASYIPWLGSPTTVTLTYQVTILPETAPGTNITFDTYGTLGTGDPTGPDEISITVAAPPDYSLSITANPSNPAPGDIVTVTVQHLDPAYFGSPGSLQGSVPAGTALVPGSSGIDCTSFCLNPATSESATLVSASYSSLLDSPTTVTLTYQVTIQLGTEGTAISFEGNGTTNTDEQTGPDSTTIQVAAPQVLAQDQSLTVPFEGSGNGTLIATGGTQPYAFLAVTQPDKGEVIVNPDGTFTYTANPGLTGTDSFTFSVTDSAATPQTAMGTVTITIAEPETLVATTLTVETNADASVSGNLADQVTGGIAPYTFTVATGPTQGTLTLNPDGTFTYIPDQDASGTDSFTYTVTDSAPVPQVSAAASTTGTVTIIITTAATTPTPGPTETPTNPGTVVPGDEETTATAPTGDPDDDDGDPVAKLPSTGSGGSGTTPAYLTFLLLTAAFALIASAILKGYRRSR